MHSLVKSHKYYLNTPLTEMDLTLENLLQKKIEYEKIRSQKRGLVVAMTEIGKLIKKYWWKSEIYS